MKIVAREILNVELSQIPSERTCLRILDAGHVLSYMQVCSAILESTNVTLHSDGTDKDHRKYLGHQFSTSDGQKLSTGFVPIASETSAGLLDVAVSVLDDLADAYTDNPAAKQEVFKDMLATVTSTMNDRAANVKGFSSKLDEKRQEVIGQADCIEALHCNAHFLLGLSAECEKALKEMEQDLKPLGRDKEAKFQRFHSTESSASRYIRLACGILGPRGDEKNGCRQYWEAFCAQEEIRSCITSFKNNRFNNFFEGAAMLHSQRALITDFLHNHNTVLNQKAESVRLDCVDDTIDSMLIALSMLFVAVTGPFWALLHSDTHYLEFYKHVVALEQHLETWSNNPELLMAPQEIPLFPGFQLAESEALRQVSGCSLCVSSWLHHEPNKQFWKVVDN